MPASLESTMNLNPTYLVVYAALLFGLAGCGSNTNDILPDKSVEYKREKQAERSLEVPPDLTPRRSVTVCPAP